MARLRVPPLLLNLLLSVASVAVAAGVLEGVARLFEKERPQTAAYITDWAWDDDFYTVKSTAAGWPPWEDYNKDGMRDREHEEEKPAGVRRVACLGDSVTLGWGITPAQAWPQVLQDRLDAQGRRVEVFNVAMGGWSTRQEVYAYRRIARRYRPDQVLLGVCLNDIPEVQNNLTRPPRFLTRLHERSALFRRLVGAQAREISNVEELFTLRESAKVKEAFGRFFAEVRTLRDEVKKDGAELAVLVFPFRFQVAPGAPEPTVQQEILGFCRREGIPAADLLPALEPLGEPAYHDYDHFSPLGARRVASAVLASGLLGGGRGAEAPLPDKDPAAALRELQAKKPESPAELAATVWAAGEMGAEGRAILPLLQELLAHPDPSVRAAAAWALGQMEAEARAASPQLVKLLADGEDRVRWRAGEALSRTGAESSTIPALVALARDPQAPARAWAVWTLGNLGPAAAESVPALVGALGDPREDVRWRAAWALGRLGEAAAPAVPALVAALQDDAIRWRVAEALGGIGPAARAAVPPLLQALDDPSSSVRLRAATALGRIGEEAAAEPLGRAAGDRMVNVRLEAVIALGRLGTGAAGQKGALFTALLDADSRVRAQAARSLGRVGIKEAQPALQKATQDEDPLVRHAATRALKRLSGERAPAGSEGE